MAFREALIPEHHGWLPAPRLHETLTVLTIPRLHPGPVVRRAVSVLQIKPSGPLQPFPLCGVSPSPR